MAGQLSALGRQLAIAASDFLGSKADEDGASAYFRQCPNANMSSRDPR